MSNFFNTQSLLLMIAFIFTPHFLFAQELKSGPCPKVKPMDNFDTNKMSSLWYVLARTPVEDAKKIQFKSFCLQYQFHPTNGSKVLISTYFASKTSQMYNITSESIITGSGTGTNPTTGWNYTFLYTDYDNVASLYYCKDEDNNMHKESLWYLFTTRSPDQTSINKAIDSFEDNGLDPNDVEGTILFHCPNIL